jgi:hypothetical protein
MLPFSARGARKIAFCASLLALGVPLAAQELHLLPQPLEITVTQSSFPVNAQTRIVVARAHAAEDKVAAEMLAEEIARYTGRKPSITVAPAMPAVMRDVIYLVRWEDDGRARTLLAAQGLKNFDRKLGEEGYLLLADSSKVMVAGGGGAGLFYGVQTLRQLIRPQGGKAACPGVQVRDWPAMPWRGVHDDVSRGPVPTLEQLKREVRTLSEYKVNLFSLYMENVFDTQSEPLIPPPEGKLTAAEIKELVAYAARYHVTVMPEQQAFGHLHHVLKYERYNDLAETPHGHVLAPVNEKSYALIANLYAEIAPLFPGPLFHIGSDETFELGKGQTKTKAEQVGLGRVYLEHLQRVAGMMKPYNKRLLFWGDVALRYPELLGILPKEMIPVPWDYDPKPSFDNIIKPFRDAGFDVMVSPGANNWGRLYPDLEAAYVNTHNFVRDGRKYGAIGVLNTTWDDDGETLFGMTWPALAYGAAASWEADDSPIERFRGSYDWAFYRNGDATFRQATEKLARSHPLLDQAGVGGAYDDWFWVDPFTPEGAALMKRAQPAAHEMRLAAEEALDSLARHRAAARLHPETLESMELAGWRLDTLGMQMQFTTEINAYYWDAYQHQDDGGRVYRDIREITGINARLEDLRDATTRVRGLYAKAWAAENRPYWLENVLVRYDMQALRYQQKIGQVEAALRQYRASKTLPAPESLGFYLKPEAAAAAP